MCPYFRPSAERRLSCWSPLKSLFREKITRLRRRFSTDSTEVPESEVYSNIYDEIVFREDNPVYENVNIKQTKQVSENTSDRKKVKGHTFSKSKLKQSRETTQPSPYPSEIDFDSVYSSIDLPDDSEHVYGNFQPRYDVVPGTRFSDTSYENNAMEQSIWHTLSPEMNAVRLNMLVDVDRFDDSFA